MNEFQIIVPKPPSLNKFYSGKHWTYRKRMADTYKLAVKQSLYDTLGLNVERDWLRFQIDISYNSRYDVDNSILCSKFVADALVDMGFVKDDNTTYYKKVTIRYEPELPKETYLVKITYYV